MPLFSPPVPPAILANDAVSFSGASTNNAVAQNVYLFAFELAAGVQITAARWRNGSTAASTTNMAIYTAAGNLVSGSDTGPQTNVASTETTYTYATPFWLAPGAYYMALACNGTDSYLSNALAAAIQPITRARKAQNTLAGSPAAMPSTLGLIQTSSVTPAMAFLVSGGLT